MPDKLTEEDEAMMRAERRAEDEFSRCSLEPGFCDGWLAHREWAARGSVTLPNEEALKCVDDVESLIRRFGKVEDPIAGEWLEKHLATIRAALVAAPSRPERDEEAEPLVFAAPGPEAVAAGMVPPSAWPAATEDPADDPLIEGPMDRTPIGNREPSDDEVERVAKALTAYCKQARAELRPDDLARAAIAALQTPGVNERGDE